jgi:hypothetical protein
MPVPRKYDEETRARAVRMYTDRLREHAESKLESRRQVGAVLDIAPATLDRIAATRSPGRPMPHEAGRCTSEPRGYGSPRRTSWVQASEQSPG